LQFPNQTDQRRFFRAAAPFLPNAVRVFLGSLLIVFFRFAAAAAFFTFLRAAEVCLFDATLSALVRARCFVDAGALIGGLCSALTAWVRGRRAAHVTSLPRRLAAVLVGTRRPDALVAPARRRAAITQSAKVLFRHARFSVKDARMLCKDPSASA
jgi:hypothetical protein